MELSQFEILIRKEFMEGLLDAFSPDIVYRREYTGQHSSGFEIGVVTSACKFLFVWEEGGGVMIAPLSSNFENTGINWFSLERVICFLANQPFTWDSPYQNLPREEKIRLTLQFAKKELARHINKVISMFSSEKVMSGWILDYEIYADEQFKLKYPAYYENYMQQKQLQKQKRLQN